MTDFTITEFTIDYVPQAMELLKQGYQREQKYIPFLPDFSTTEDKTGEFQWFANEKLGFMAVKNEELLGFFCYYPPFRGVYNTETEYGSWSPLHAHGIKEMDEKQTEMVWSRLVQAAMEKASQEGTFYHSVTLFRHEILLSEVLHMYGFGNRFADSMLDVGSYEMIKAKSDKFSGDFSIRQTCQEDFSALRELRRELSYHLAKVPCFCIHNENQFEEHIHERETSENLVTFGLYNPQEELIGFIDTNEDDGENFISQGTTILNISGMFLSEKYRGQGLSPLLVDAAVEEAKNLGKAVLGVDYETMNPTARGFWEKYFTPYTISLVRRVDIGRKKLAKYYRVHTADIAYITQQPRGIFTAIGKLVDSKILNEAETVEYWKNRKYFEKLLPVPPFYEQGNPDKATAWFKNTHEGNDIYQQMTFYREMAAKYGLQLYKSECDEVPGEIIYEDDFQIAVKNTPVDLKVKITKL